MAFGQQNGPPASARQLKDLQALLEQAGYATFREARGPLGFSQRQGGGKFTSAEAAAYIEQLEAAAETEADAEVEGTDDERNGGRAADAAAAPRRPRQPSPSPAAGERRDARQASSARGLPAHVLAHELERRGWMLIPPEDFTPPGPPST